MQTVEIVDDAPQTIEAIDESSVKKSIDDHSFSLLNLSEQTTNAIKDLQFTKMTKIQKMSIPAGK